MRQVNLRKPLQNASCKVLRTHHSGARLASQGDTVVIRKHWHALLARIEEMGGEQVFLDRIASGESVRNIACDYKTSRSHFMFYLHRTEERWTKYQAARLRAPAAERLPPRSRQILTYGGEQKILEDVAAGKTMTKIAAAIGITRPMLLSWLRDDYRKWERYEKARIESAGALADEAIDLVDDVDVSDPVTANAKIRKAETQATMRKWRAGITDRANFGSQEQGAGNVNIGALHLNALIKLGGPQSGKPAVPQLEGATITVDQIGKGE